MTSVNKYEQVFGKGSMAFAYANAVVRNLPMNVAKPQKDNSKEQQKWPA